MSKKTLSRRNFLAGLTLLSCLPSLAKSAILSKSKQTIFINGHHDQMDSFYIGGVNVDGEEQFKLPLPEMPHGFAVSPNNSNMLVTFPGLTGVKTIVTDVANGKKIAEINIRKGRHFNGHGVFSPDGKFLFTTENSIETSDGVIGVYETKNFSFVREFTAYGLGPHGIDILPDGKSLVVASGGLRTRPDTGKYYFDINKMQSSVVYIDAKNGKLLHQIKEPIHRLSIRQAIVFGDDGDVLVVCQYKGKRVMPKLVGIQRGSGEIAMLDIDDDSLSLMNGYVGHVVIAGDIAAVSAPRGKGMFFWNLKQKKFLGLVEINDVSGVQPIDNSGNFIASANTGELYKMNANTLKSSLLTNLGAEVKWTNHMIKMVV